MLHSYFYRYRHAEMKTGQTEETLLVEIYNVKKDLNETIRELEEQKRLNQKMFVQFDVVKFHMHNMRITNKTDIAGNSLQGKSDFSLFYDFVFVRNNSKKLI